MKDLLSRLKPEILLEIENQKIKYPNTMAEIESELKNNTHAYNVKYGIALDLIQLNINTCGKVLSLYHCFI